MLHWLWHHDGILSMRAMSYTTITILLLICHLKCPFKDIRTHTSGIIWHDPTWFIEHYCQSLNQCLGFQSSQSTWESISINVLHCSLSATPLCPISLLGPGPIHMRLVKNGPVVGVSPTRWQVPKLACMDF